MLTQICESRVLMEVLPLKNIYLILKKVVLLELRGLNIVFLAVQTDITEVFFITKADSVILKIN